MAKLSVWFKETFDLPFTLTCIKDTLLKASSEYYNTEDSIMSDTQYDVLREFYEKKSGETLPVGAAPLSAGLELSHSYKDFAGTLHKCKSVQDVEAWAKTKKYKGLFVVSIKCDGHSITVEWTRNSKGAMVIDKALTRGEDGVGKDLTKLFKANAKLIPTPTFMVDDSYAHSDCAVGYEAIITYKDFELLSKETNNKYKNPRSAVGGILSNSGQALFKYITLVPLRFKAADYQNLGRYEQMGELAEMANYELLETCTTDLEGIERLYNEHEEARARDDRHQGFMYDGLVIEIADDKVRTKLGYSSTEPNFATALKFTPKSSDTKLLDIEWSVEGHTARFTPKAIFDPVVIRGNTYKQVSLANLDRFNSMDLHVGDPLTFSLRNDTLGYIDKLKSSRSLVGVHKFEVPKFCPSCGSELVHDTFLDCVNTKCDLNIIGSIIAFTEKMGVKNVGPEMIRAMHAHGAVESRDELLILDKEYLSRVEGFGQTTVSNILNEYSKVFNKPVNDYTLLGSLNIPGFGRGRAKVLLANMTLEELQMSSEKSYEDFVKDLSNIATIGEATIDTLYEHLNDVDGLTTGTDLALFKDHFKIIDSKVNRGADFVQMTFVHTGSASPMKDRAALTAFVEKLGHKMASSVSKNTTFLINNDVDSTTGKNAKAKELGVKIISVQSLMHELADPNWD